MPENDNKDQAAAVDTESPAGVEDSKKKGMITDYGYIPREITDYDQLAQAKRMEHVADEFKEEAMYFPQLVRNILDSEETDKVGLFNRLTSSFASKAAELFSSSEKAVTKKDGNVERTASEFAYVPDPTKPSTWKLPITDDNHKVTKEKLGQAAAAFSSGGFRGNKVEIPSADKSKVKAKIRAAYKKLGVKDSEIPNSVKSLDLGLYVWKSAGGLYQWLARYSNNFKDREEEIISRESHLWFIDQVQKGLVPYPELWLWHNKDWKVGEATFLAWDEQEKGTGFALAGGYFYDWAEPVAKALSEVDGDILVSHGMPKVSIIRDKENKNILRRHITKEISPLPPRAAANEWTGFASLKPEQKDKESIMTIKKKVMTDEWGVDGNILEAIEAQNKSIASKNVDDGIETKEKADAEEVPTEEAPAAEEPKEEAEAESKEGPTTDEEFLAEPATRSEVLEAVKEMRSQIIDEVKKEMTTLGQEIVKGLTASQEAQAQELKENLDKSPRSLLNFLNKERATEAEETKVKDGKVEGPKETKAQKGNVGGIPILSTIAGGGDWRKEIKPE